MTRRGTDSLSPSNGAPNERSPLLTGNAARRDSAANVSSRASLSSNLARRKSMPAILHSQPTRRHSRAQRGVFNSVFNKSFQVKRKYSPQKKRQAEGTGNIDNNGTSATNRTIPEASNFHEPLLPNGNDGDGACNSESQSRRKKKHKHSFLYSMLSPHSHSWQAGIFKRFISLVILLELTMFCLGTDESLRLPAQYQDRAEGVVSCIFLCEYLARLVTITESHRYPHPIWGRLSYIVSWGALIDLCATLPWFLEFFTSYELPTLTQLRVFRLTRILKTEGYIRAADTVYRVIYYNSEILYVGLMLCIYLVLFTGLALYYFRPASSDADSQFASIPKAMVRQTEAVMTSNLFSFASLHHLCLLLFAFQYMSTLLLCGQGGPDESEETPWYTRTIVLITSIFSVAMFAIPASMLTWGFEAEAERMAKQSRRREVKKRQEEQKRSQRQLEQEESGEFYGDSDTSTAWSDSDGNTTDEEYFRLIAGEEEDGSDDDDDSFVKQLKQNFKSADGDADGTLTLKEFIAMNNQLHWNQQPGGTPSDPSIKTSNPRLEARISALEKAAKDNAEKLDLILKLVQKRQK